jgi:hypothetical protein
MLEVSTMRPRLAIRARSAGTYAALLLIALSTIILTAFNTPDPSSVTVAGTLQTALGCPGDWQPDCAASHLTYDAADTVWQGTFTIPAGSYQYKAALNDSWNENYGLNALLNGANIPLSLPASTPVKFYYDHKTHWITDNKNSVIATAAGDFQSELGCPGDWQPDCLRSWLEDPDGDGTYTFSAVLPMGNYQAKVAINEAWDENYGAGGVAGGANIPFTVAGAGYTTTFEYNASTHVLTITSVSPNQPPVARAKNVTAQADASCQASVAPSDVDAGSYDPDGDPFTLSLSPAGPFALGQTAVILSAQDSHGATGTAPAIVTVVDKTPPSIANLHAFPPVLWPPNQRMVNVAVGYGAADACGSASCVLTVTSSQPVSGPGFGLTSPDWQVVGPHLIRLRAERFGPAGRVYTITVTCTDGSGNVSSKTTTVLVPR